MTSKQNKFLVWGLYSLGVYILLLPYGLWITSIPISILVGFLFGLINEVITQLRVLNGEKLLGDKKDVL